METAQQVHKEQIDLLKLLTQVFLDLGYSDQIPIVTVSERDGYVLYESDPQTPVYHLAKRLQELTKELADFDRVGTTMNEIDTYVDPYLREFVQLQCQMISLAINASLSKVPSDLTRSDLPYVRTGNKFAVHIPQDFVND